MKRGAIICSFEIYLGLNITYNVPHVLDGAELPVDKLIGIKGNWSASIWRCITLNSLPCCGI